MAFLLNQALYGNGGKLPSTGSRAQQEKTLKATQQKLTTDPYGRRDQLQSRPPQPIIVKGLQFQDSVESYLPPPGKYYDQPVLEKLFDLDSSKQKCLHCLQVTCPHVHKMSLCKEDCGVCGTRQHLGRECTMMYCNFLWWTKRGHYPAESTRLRPGKMDATVLAN
jgi:hypothetical protein